VSSAIASAKGENMGTPEEETNCYALTYATWLAKANKRIETAIGLSLDDLPDGNTRAAWEDGEDPVVYADGVLEDEGFEG
jgi:hypothetical protein